MRAVIICTTCDIFDNVFLVSRNVMLSGIQAIAILYFLMQEVVKHTYTPVKSQQVHGEWL